MIRFLSKVIATFNPKKCDDLKEGLSKHIGKTFEFTAAFIIEVGEYEGQWAFMGSIDFAPEWVPECDLDIIS